MLPRWRALTTDLSGKLALLRLTNFRSVLEFTLNLPANPSQRLTPIKSRNIVATSR